MPSRTSRKSSKGRRRKSSRRRRRTNSRGAIWNSIKNLLSPKKDSIERDDMGWKLINSNDVFENYFIHLPRFPRKPLQKLLQKEFTNTIADVEKAIKKIDSLNADSYNEVIFTSKRPNLFFQDNSKKLINDSAITFSHQKINNNFS